MRTGRRWCILVLNLPALRASNQHWITNIVGSSSSSHSPLIAIFRLLDAYTPSVSWTSNVDLWQLILWSFLTTLTPCNRGPGTFHLRTALFGKSDMKRSSSDGKWKVWSCLLCRLPTQSLIFWCRYRSRDWNWDHFSLENGLETSLVTLGSVTFWSQNGLETGLRPFWSRKWSRDPVSSLSASHTDWKKILRTDCLKSLDKLNLSYILNEKNVISSLQN